MEDIDKQRATYVVELEEKLQHAMEQLAIYKPIAEKWEPKANAFIDPQDKQVRFVLQFGGKRVTALLNLNTVAGNTAADITSTVAQTFFEQLVLERLGEVLRPEAEKVCDNARAVTGAGKW